jgi:hypothetical protein
MAATMGTIAKEAREAHAAWREAVGKLFEKAPPRPTEEEINEALASMGLAKAALRALPAF